jgi:hypothetical protein
MSGGLAFHRDFEALGMNHREMARHTIKLQNDIVKDMLDGDGGEQRHDAVRGLLNPARGFGPKILDFMHPQGGRDQVSPWHRFALRWWTKGARLADRALA